MTTVVRVGRGPPLVLLHCLGVDRRLWEIAAAGLHDRFELVSYDFPGHGTTPVPERPYTIEDLSDQLAALLQRERLTRVHLAGISLGGLVAQCAAASHPDMVDRLVLIDTTPRYTGVMRAAWYERAAIARARRVAAMTGRLLDIWFTADCLAGNGPAVRYVRECFACCAGEGYRWPAKRWPPPICGPFCGRSPRQPSWSVAGRMCRASLTPLSSSRER